MSKNKQPVDLIMLKGKKHLTKEEVKKRQKTEVKAPLSTPEAPKHLKADQKRSFDQTAKKLYDVGIMSELDSDILAFYIDSYTKYLEYNKMVTATIRKINKAKVADRSDYYEELSRLEGLRDKTIKQCRGLAGDLGLTISSRCRLVIPKAPEAPKENKYARFTVG
jgi:P27 family predicted phage terminase small subunit